MSTSIVDVYPLVAELRGRLKHEWNVELSDSESAKIIAMIVQLALGTVDTRIYQVIARNDLRAVPHQAALTLLTQMVDKLAYMVTEIAQVDVTLVTHEVEYHLNMHGTLAIYQRPKPVADNQFEIDRAAMQEAINNGDFIPEWERRAYKL